MEFILFPNPAISMSLRVKRSNLAVTEEIAAHLSGARNDVSIKRLGCLSLDLGCYIYAASLIIEAAIVHSC